MRRIQFVRQLVGFLSAAGLLVPAITAQAAPVQSAPKSSHAKKKADTASAGISIVTGVSVVEEKGTSAVEILSTLPSVPSIQFLDSPPRLVIDLLHAQIGLKEKPGDVHAEPHPGANQGDILAVRTEQFQADPPITRVVLDLKVPYAYTWDEEGNRLMVRLKPVEDANAATRTSRMKTRPVLGTASAINPSLSANEVSLDQSKIAPGSTLTSGTDIAVLHLSRGGEVRICPGSAVSVTPSKTNKDLMLGMNTGALETHYALQSSADTVMTPDFRILFAGPGEFDFAVSTNAHGDTCVRGLQGNGSSAIVSELMGDRIYQVKPNEQAVFRGGQIDKVDNNIPLECGCPTSPLVMRTEVGPAAAPGANSTVAQSTVSALSSTPAAGTPGNLAAGNKDLPPLSNGPEIRPVPPSDPNAVHVQVEAPMVFHAKQEPSEPNAPASPGPASDGKNLPVTRPRAEPDQPAPSVAVTPPATAPVAQAQPAQPQKPIENPSGPRRVMRRIKGFFSSIFH